MPQISATYHPSKTRTEVKDERKPVGRTVTFVPTQLAGQSQVPVSYTSTPSRLFWYEIQLVISKAGKAAGVFLPLRYGKQSDPYDELYFSPENFIAVGLQSILAISQTLFVISLPTFFIAPVFWLVLYGLAFYTINGFLCQLLNGTDIKVYPSVDVDQDDRFSNEYWIFINGVATGQVTLLLTLLR